MRDISWRVWELIGSRKDRWGRKSQLEMAKRKEMRALEKELERLEAEKEARRQERRGKRRLEEEGTLIE